MTWLSVNSWLRSVDRACCRRAPRWVDLLDCHVSTRSGRELTRLRVNSPLLSQLADSLPQTTVSRERLATHNTMTRSSEFRVHNTIAVVKYMESGYSQAPISQRASRAPAATQSHPTSATVGLRRASARMVQRLESIACLFEDTHVGAFACGVPDGTSVKVLIRV